MLGRLVEDQSLVTDEAVADRARAMQAGQATFATMFPAPRPRWVVDLTIPAEVLETIDAPVLLVHGARDRLTPLSTAALPLLAHLTDVRLHVLGHCGHAPPVEHPLAFQRLVRDFLTP